MPHLCDIILWHPNNLCLRLYFSSFSKGYFCDSWRNDTNVILADEMGLGKTVQSVSMLGFLQVSCMLICCIASETMSTSSSCS